MLVGILKDTLNVPFASVVLTGVKVNGAESKVTDSALFAAKPEPLALTLVPIGPLTGLGSLGVAVIVKTNG